MAQPSAGPQRNEEEIPAAMQSPELIRSSYVLTLEEIGIDQIVVDEAQEFRKLTFATNQVNLKGVDPKTDNMLKITGDY